MSNRPSEDKPTEKNHEKVLRPPYFDIRWLILTLGGSLCSNAFECRSGANFKGPCVSLVFVSWLPHIARCAVKHGRVRRECGYNPTLYCSPPPMPLSLVLYTPRRVRRLSALDIAQCRALIGGHLRGVLYLPTNRVCP